MIITKQWQDTPIMDTAHKVDARNLYNTPYAMITVITLEPSEALKPHITPVDVAFYVLTGTATVEIGDEQVEATANTLVESPKKIKHCIYNHGNEVVRFMVIKAPRPTTKTIFIGA